MSKFQIGDEVCLSGKGVKEFSYDNWADYSVPYAMYNGDLGKVIKVEDTVKGSQIWVETSKGIVWFYEDQIEHLGKQKKECPVEEGDICLVDECLEALGYKEICVLSVDENKGRMQFCKWPIEEKFGYDVYQASVNDVAMVLFNRFEETKKEEVKQEQYTGSSSDYYKVYITNPTTLPEAYYAECNDIIEALEMDFAEGNAFKAIWRKAKAQQGVKKKGYDNGVYDSEKVVFFGERMLVKAKNEAN